MKPRLPAPPTKMTASKSFATVAALAALVGCDHATKSIAKASLEKGPPLALLRRALELRYTENTDVGFNALRWIPPHVRAPLLLGVGLASVALLALILFRLSATRAVRAALVLILAGALGNVSDRILRGYVIDFIHVSHWPVFNVADVCVSAGVALLFWARWVRGERFLATGPREEPQSR